jgi:hypothetical protein
MASSRENPLPFHFVSAYGSAVVHFQGRIRFRDLDGVAHRGRRDRVIRLSVAAGDTHRGVEQQPLAGKIANVRRRAQAAEMNPPTWEAVPGADDVVRLLLDRGKRLAHFAHQSGGPADQRIEIAELQGTALPELSGNRTPARTMRRKARRSAQSFAAFLPPPVFRLRRWPPRSSRAYHPQRFRKQRYSSADYHRSTIRPQKSLTCGTLRLPLPTGERAGVRGFGCMRKTSASEPPHPRSLRSLDLSPPGGGEMNSSSRRSRARVLPSTFQNLLPKPRGGGAPTGASNHCPRHTFRRCRRNVRGRGGPLPSLPRKRGREGRGLASRRSTAALVAATERFDSAQAALRANGRTRALPAPPSALKRSTSRAGRNAGGDDARTARERGYEPRPREPHSLRFRDRLEKRPSMIR